MPTRDRLDCELPFPHRSGRNHDIEMIVRSSRDVDLLPSLNGDGVSTIKSPLPGDGIRLFHATLDLQQIVLPIYLLIVFGATTSVYQTTPVRLLNPKIYLRSAMCPRLVWEIHLNSEEVQSNRGCFIHDEMCADADDFGVFGDALKPKVCVRVLVLASKANVGTGSRGCGRIVRYLHCNQNKWKNFVHRPASFQHRAPVA